MAACRGAYIEWFSDCSDHGGAICTPAGFRSQASCQHFTRDITLGTRITEAYPSILSITWLGSLAAHALAFREQFSFDRVNTN
jgi:hypothetical protein